MGENFVIFSFLAGVAFHQFSRFGLLGNFTFLNTSIKTQSLEGFDKFLAETFSLSPLSIKILHLTYSEYAGKDYSNISFVSFSGDNVISSLSYNGPKRLDGYPDLRYNTTSYGYTLKQTIKYSFEFTMKNGHKSNATLDGSEFSKTTQYMTSEQVKTILFQGSKNEFNEIPKAINQLNLFFQLISYTDIFNEYKIIFSAYDEITTFNETIKKLNNDLEQKNKKHANLQILTDKMTEEQFNQFKDLEKQLINIQESIKKYHKNIIDTKDSILDLQNNLITLTKDNKIEAEKKSDLVIERSKIDAIFK
jgi:hypothetical protein